MTGFIELFQINYVIQNLHEVKHFTQVIRCLHRYPVHNCIFLRHIVEWSVDFQQMSNQTHFARVRCTFHRSREKAQNLRVKKLHRFKNKKNKIQNKQIDRE